MSVPEPLSALAAAALEAIVRSPSETLVASDFDGTLAPIVDDPGGRTRILTLWPHLAGSASMSALSW